MKKIAEQYFSILDDYFKEVYEIAAKHEFVKDDYWDKMLEIYDPVTIISIMDTLYDDLSKIDWCSQEQHIKKIAGLKTSYIGSVYSYLQNISQTAQFLKKAALYADTIIVNDYMLSELFTWKKRKEVAGKFHSRWC